MNNDKHTVIGEVLASINRGMMGHGAFPPTERWKRLSILEGFIEITRPFLLMMGPPAAGIGVFLAPGSLPSPLILAFGVLAGILATAGMHTFNDWVDKERDKRIWPNRPIPAGRFPAKIAPLYALILMGLSVGIAWKLYNPMAAFILGLINILGILFCLSFKNLVGHLSLPFVIALIPIVGWASVSPETIFSSSLPWLLAAMMFVWQAGHVMVSALVHPINKDEKGIYRCERKAAFFFPTPGQAAILGLFFLSLLFIGSLLLPIMVELGIFYWCLALPAGVLTVGTAFWLLLDPMKRRRAIFAFNSASMFLMFLCSGVVLDVIFKRHLDSFFVWFLSIAKYFIALIEQETPAIEKSIYIIGLMVTVFVSFAAAGGLLKGIMKAKKASD